MRLRLVGLGLLLAAVALYVGAAGPLRRQAGEAADEYRRLRNERRTLQARVAAAERRESKQQALSAATPAWGPQDVLRGARLAVVRSLDEASLKGVRLVVEPGGGPSVRAEVRLSAEGDFDDVVRASGHLVRPGSGLILSSVRMAPRRDLVVLNLDAMVAEAARP